MQRNFVVGNNDNNNSSRTRRRKLCRACDDLAKNEFASVAHMLLKPGYIVPLKLFHVEELIFHFNHRCCTGRCHPMLVPSRLSTSCAVERVTSQRYHADALQIDNDWFKTICDVFSNHYSHNGILDPCEKPMECLANPITDPSILERRCSRECFTNSLQIPKAELFYEGQ